PLGNSSRRAEDRRSAREAAGPRREADAGVVVRPRRDGKLRGRDDPARAGGDPAKRSAGPGRAGRSPLLRPRSDHRRSPGPILTLKMKSAPGAQRHPDRASAFEGGPPAEVPAAETLAELFSGLADARAADAFGYFMGADDVLEGVSWREMIARG